MNAARVLKERSIFGVETEVQHWPWEKVRPRPRDLGMGPKPGVGLPRSGHPDFIGPVNPKERERSGRIEYDSNGEACFELVDYRAAWPNYAKYWKMRALVERNFEPRKRGAL